VVFYDRAPGRETQALLQVAISPVDARFLGLHLLRCVVRAALAGRGRRQARDDFRSPFNHLGTRARLALRQHPLDKLNRPLDLHWTSF
jgi:hypothetical protein